MTVFDRVEIETPNDNPDEVDDDGLGVTEPQPIDPADVDEDDHGEDDPDIGHEPVIEEGGDNA